MGVANFDRWLLKVRQTSAGIIKSYLSFPTRQVGGFELCRMSGKEVVDVGVNSDRGSDNTDSPAVSKCKAKSGPICCNPTVASVHRLNRSKTGSD